MMFNVTDGGIVEPIELNAQQLSSDKSVIVMDEESLRVWLWHGKKRGLVPRRTALRQAESLKGNGYQAGNAIVGRGIQSIVEIDERKVGQVEDDTKLNEEFMALLNRPYRQLNDFLFVPGSESEESEAPKPKMAAPKVEAPKAKPAAISKPSCCQTSTAASGRNSIESSNR